MGPKLKPKPTQKQKQEYTITTLIVFSSVIIGYLSGDLVLGGLLLATGLITSYFASIRKRANYIVGFVNALLLSYVAYKNNLFGSFAVNAFIFAPLEIYGFIAWSRNLDSKKDVKIRKFNLKLSLIVVSSCVIGSVLLGLMLTLIPGQQLAFMDSTINCLDICALILLNLRYNESWILWVMSGILSVIIWAIALSNGGANAFMRLLAAIGFLVVNTYGAIKWYSKLKSN